MVIAAEHRPCPKLVQLDQCSGLSVVFGKGTRSSPRGTNLDTGSSKVFRFVFL